MMKQREKNECVGALWRILNFYFRFRSSLKHWVRYTALKRRSGAAVSHMVSALQSFLILSHIYKSNVALWRKLLPSSCSFIGILNYSHFFHFKANQIFDWSLSLAIVCLFTFCWLIWGTFLTIPSKFYRSSSRGNKDSCLNRFRSSSRISNA